MKKSVDEILQLTNKKKSQNSNSSSLVENNSNISINNEFILITLLRSKIKVSDFGLSKFKEDNNQKW